MKLLLALVASTVFVPVALPDAEVCAAEGALACVVLAPGDAVVRVDAKVPAAYVVEATDGTPLARGVVDGGLLPIPPGAARLVVRAA